MAAKSSAKSKKKSAARRATTKKSAKASTPKRAATKKAAHTAKPKALGKLKDPMTNSEVLAYLSEQTGVAKKDVKAIFETLPSIIKSHIAKDGPGTFNLMGMLKVLTQHKPAVKARKGTNPFTGEEMMFKAKKARTVVKARPMKKLKDLV